jgi:hypothetical protein
MDFHLSHLTFNRFQLLSPRAQFLLTMLEGTYLAQHDQGKAGVTLYHLPDGAQGFFIEVGFNKTQGCFAVLRSFVRGMLLDKYLCAIVLSDAW